MKKFKLIDPWLQTIVLVGSVLYVLIADELFFIAYFITGGFQLASWLIHLVATSSFTPHKSRKFYSICLISILVISLLAFLAADYLGDGFILYLVFVLVFTAIMAIWYLVILIEEAAMVKQQSDAVQ